MNTQSFCISNIMPLVLTVFIALFGVWISADAADQSSKEPAITNAMCPVLPDEPVDPTIYSDYEGKRVYFCCRMCRNKFNDNPEKYLDHLAQFTADDKHHEGHEEEYASHASEEHDHDNDHTEVTADSATSLETHGRDTNEVHEDQAVHGEEHDHARDHKTTSGEISMIARLMRYVGKLHPLVVHFPIALILAAGLAELLGLMFGNDRIGETARYCLALAALGAIAAMILGWINASFGNHPGMENILAWHRWLGVISTVMIALAWALGEAARRNKSAPLRKAYLIVLFTSCIFIAATGHFGASLVYGWDYLTTF